MLTQVDMKSSPFYGLDDEYHQANGDVPGKLEKKRAVVRRLLNRLDITQVAILLEVSVDDVKRIVANDNVARRSS